MMFSAMLKKVVEANGFLAALDQSGGSTPKALKAYGVPEHSFVAGEESMYDRVHEMRTRIMTSDSFTGDKVLGAILFANTMERSVNGVPTAQYLWETKNIVPFLKCDQGLCAEENGVQLMKPMPQLDTLLKRGKEMGIFGTKMRSNINAADETGIRAIIEQQFAVGLQILEHGLIPILEPEINIHSVDKEACEELLKKVLLEQLNKLPSDKKIMLKLTLPTHVNHYKEIIDHPNVLRVVALSGGYSMETANRILAKQTGMIASFSRALAEDLKYEQSPEEFNAALGHAVDAIYKASKSG